MFKKQKTTKLSSRGFTLIELMVAISALSTILLIVAVGIIQITKTYYKGITQANTQQTTRAIMDNLTQAVEFGDYNNISFPAPGNGSGFITNAYCVGQDRFTFVSDVQKIESQPSDAASTATPNPHVKHALWQDSSPVGICDASLDLGSASPSGVGHELLGDNMRVTALTITQSDPQCTGDLWCVTLSVMYGDDDLIDMSNPDHSQWSCKPSPGIFSAAFCAKALWTSVVGKRLQGS